jgi:hypothetical protein
MEEKTEKKVYNETATLTAEEIYEIENISNDKAGARSALRVALNFHSNVTAVILNKERKWWKTIMRLYNLDPTKPYMVDTMLGMVVVRQMDKEEEESFNRMRMVDSYGGKG